MFAIVVAAVAFFLGIDVDLVVVLVILFNCHIRSDSSLIFIIADWYL